MYMSVKLRRVVNDSEILMSDFLVVCSNKTWLFDNLLLTKTRQLCSKILKTQQPVVLVNLYLFCS